MPCSKIIKQVVAISAAAAICYTLLFSSLIADDIPGACFGRLIHAGVLLGYVNALCLFLYSLQAAALPLIGSLPLSLLKLMLGMLVPLQITYVIVAIACDCRMRPKCPSSILSSMRAGLSFSKAYDCLRAYVLHCVAQSETILHAGNTIAALLLWIARPARPSRAVNTAVLMGYFVMLWYAHRKTGTYVYAFLGNFSYSAFAIHGAIAVAILLAVTRSVQCIEEGRRKRRIKAFVGKSKK